MASKNRRSGNPAKRAAVEGPLYWHGGRPGLVVGDVLVPGRANQKALTLYADQLADYAEGAFITDNRQFARAWASSYPVRQGGTARGTLYQVRPEGELSRDPDYLHGAEVSWYCPRAVVVRVAEQNVSLSETEEVRAVGPFAFWEDGTPQYTADGYLTFHPDHAKTGVTPEMLPKLGKWRSIYSDMLNYELAFLAAQQRGEAPADATLDDFRAEVQAALAAGEHLPPLATPAEMASRGSA